MAWKLGGNRTPFASIMANSLTGGWHSTGGSGYYNRFTGETMSGGDFLNNTPYLTSPEYVDYSPGAVANTVMGSREMELLPGTDPLGNRMAIFTYPNGKVSGGPVPFWDITGSYYNELYYFSGLVAFDTYAAKESMSYWDMIRTTDFPKPIMGMPPPIAPGGGQIKAFRTILKSWSKVNWRSVSSAAKYHYSKHVLNQGMRNNLMQYTDDALNFFNTNKNLGKEIMLRDGSMGMKIRLGPNQPGGIFTTDGRIVSFWYY